MWKYPSVGTQDFDDLRAFVGDRFRIGVDRIDNDDDFSGSFATTEVHGTK